MATLPIIIQGGALNPALRYTPQQFFDAIVARMSLVTSQTFALFVTGSTEPTSNVGPWLKNGNEWYVWSDSAGGYVPIGIQQASLGYIISSLAPDHEVYQIWIRTEASGSPISVNIWYSGGWVDVYAAQLATYQTIAAFDTAISNYSTTAQMNAAIANAAAGITSYRSQANNSVPQSLLIGIAPVVLQLDQAFINSANNFDITTYRYVASIAGDYSCSAITQFDNSTGDPSAMQAIIALFKNGSNTGIQDLDSTPSPSGSRWSPGFGGMMISLAIGDYIDLRASFDDGINTGAVNLTTCHFSVFKLA